MPEKFRCFWCVVEMVNAQKFGEGNDVVTQYQGTPMCSTHAARIGRSLTSREEQPWGERETVHA